MISAEAQRQKIYVLDSGKSLMLALSAGRAAEPSGGSEGTYQAFPRAVLLPVTGQERH